MKLLAVTNVGYLIAAIIRYKESHNNKATPFVWTASAESVLAKVSRANKNFTTLQ